MGGGQLKYGIEKFTDFVDSNGTGQHQVKEPDVEPHIEPNTEQMQSPM